MTLMRRCFLSLLFFLVLLCPTGMKAQYQLVAGGEVVAHGLQRCGTMPEALATLVGARSLRIADEAAGTPMRLRARSLLRRYVSEETQTVGPLLPSVRDQEAPYNLLCPYWTDEAGEVSKERCLSGCVATAIEQVMAYYRYPEALLDTLHGWTTDNYALDDLLPGTRFDWDNYLNDYRDGWTEAQGAAIALTSLACGMAVHMQYGLNASGANVSRGVEPLQRAFGYGMVRYFERVLYTPERWHAMLRHELDEGRPIVYCGHNMAMGGHAFNIDGYDASGYYHVNWGYNGSYDGWFDLDWLNPWEQIDLDPQGIAEGFFCNQSALFMHPSADAQPLACDSLHLADLGVELEDVRFLRQPDVQGYVMADFDFVNRGQDSVTYTFEVMSYLPTDTAVFMQADYIGLSGFNIAPGEHLTQRVYLQFSEVGERILGISDDDVTIPFSMPVSVARGTQPQLQWGTLECQSLVASESDPESYEMAATIPVTNVASGGYAGSLVTFCLFEEAVDFDMRHYKVLSTPAGQTETLDVTFTHLKPGTHYRLLVRCPWSIQAEMDFDTPKPSAVDEVPSVSAPASKVRYDLVGRRTKRTKGILIQDGRKTAYR